LLGKRSQSKKLHRRISRRVRKITKSDY